MPTDITARGWFGGWVLTAILYLLVAPTTVPGMRLTAEAVHALVAALVLFLALAAVLAAGAWSARRLKVVTGFVALVALAAVPAVILLFRVGLRPDRRILLVAATVVFAGVTLATLTALVAQIRRGKAEGEPP